MVRSLPYGRFGGKRRKAARPEGRPVDITTESTESRFCGLRRAKRKEAVSVESVGRRVCRKAVHGGGFPRKAFVDLFDWRASEGDKWPGSVAFRNCTAGEGLGALLGCSTIKANGHLGRDKDPTKVLDFVFEGNSLAPGAVERAELPRRR